MTPPLRRIVAAVAALLTGMMLLRRRPVPTPDRDGSWRPID
jgi:hypothetical protein